MTRVDHRLTTQARETPFAEWTVEPCEDCGIPAVDSRCAVCESHTPPLTPRQIGLLQSLDGWDELEVPARKLKSPPETRPVDPNPTVGMGATLWAGSLAYPCTVVAVSASGKSVTVTRDGSIYGGPMTFSLRRSGMWVERGKRTGRNLRIGERYSHFDRGF